jgi:hypothetical protein
MRRSICSFLAIAHDTTGPKRPDEAALLNRIGRLSITCQIETHKGDNIST